jgi:hypothetical protein
VLASATLWVYEMKVSGECRQAHNRRTTITTVRPLTRSPARHFSTIHLEVCTLNTGRVSSAPLLIREEISLKSREDVIEEQDLCLGIDSTSQRETCLLTTRQCQSLLADLCFVPSVEEAQVTGKTALVDNLLIPLFVASRSKQDVFLRDTDVDMKWNLAPKYVTDLDCLILHPRFLGSIGNAAGSGQIEPRIRRCWDEMHLS